MSTEPELAAVRPQTAAGGRKCSGKGHGSRSEAVRDNAILALLSERTITEAARRCGVGERTLRRWLTEPAFKAGCDAARAEIFQNAMARIQVLVHRAVDTLADLLAARKHPAVRLGAARTVVEVGLHQHEATTILRKLAEIEAAQRAIESHRRK